VLKLVSDACYWTLFPRSFAYLTIKDRTPQILTKVIDTLHRHKSEFFEKHGEVRINLSFNFVLVLHENNSIYRRFQLSCKDLCLAQILTCFSVC